MKEILLFAGTTEGRKLSEYLWGAGISHTVCVATEYGEIVLQNHPTVTVHKGRMNEREIREFVKSGQFAAVVDATHPYACQVTENIKAALEGMEIPYYRLKRRENDRPTYEKIYYFQSNETCAAALEKTEGNILLTTGSKELEKYAGSESLKKRLYVRVLPGVESISLCTKQGICGKQILALQGPFSEELNLAILRQYEIACMVTKESGISGGYGEKIEAARKADIPVFVIGKPSEEGLSFEEVCSKLFSICSKDEETEGRLEVILAGTGMGSIENLTREVWEAISEADILLGAERMIEPYKPHLEKRPYYLASQIIPYLKEIQKQILPGQVRKAVILFSGDSGFYSGSQKLYQQLLEETESGTLQAEIRILPGISSVSYFASCLGESYQDGAIQSIHGKTSHKEENGWQTEITDTIKHHAKTFLLMSGAEDVQRLGDVLLRGGLSGCMVTVGYQLSYPDQEIRTLSPGECRYVKKKGLYICLIQNPFAQPRILTHGVPDGAFIRDKVPMTKEEVREISICKLHLQEGAVLYDIGSGTGSVAVEAARLSSQIRVFAIEQKQEAVSLIKQNRKKFRVNNVTVVEAQAPEGLHSLPVPTHAFIGGSGGRLKEILSELYGRNPNMRIVINAVTVETISRMEEVLSEYPIKEEEIVQVQVSRARKAGRYHLMQAENPVWICAFTFASDGNCNIEGEQ